MRLRRCWLLEGRCLGGGEAEEGRLTAGLTREAKKAMVTALFRLIQMVREVGQAVVRQEVVLVWDAAIGEGFVAKEERKGRWLGFSRRENPNFLFCRLIYVLR